MDTIDTRQMDRQINNQMDGQILDTQPDRQMNNQIDRQILDRQPDRQIDTRQTAREKVAK